MRYLILFIIILSSCAPPDEAPEFTGKTESHDFASNRMGDNFLIKIFLPKSYDSEHRYPVVYQLDGNKQGKLMAGIGQELVNQAAIDPVIVVGIGYPKGKNRRSRDYTPTKTDHYDYSGGANTYYQFLTSELIPWVEGKYRSDSTMRILSGHSLGGLFSTYALFQNERYFQGVIAASPSYWYDDGHMIDQESAFDPANETALYITVGGLEDLHMNLYYEKMTDRLSKKTELIDLRYHRYKDLLHPDTKEPSYRDGLTFILQSLNS